MIGNELRPTETLEEAEQEARAEAATVGAEAETLVADELKPHDERRSLIQAAALVRGYEIDVRNALVGVVLANDDVTLTRAGARSIFAGDNVDLRQGGAGVVIAGEQVTLRQGGAQAVISGGSLQMEQAGSGFAIARRIRIGRGGITIFAISPSIEVGEGGRVIFGRAVSIGLLAGLLGLVALLSARRRLARR